MCSCVDTEQRREGGDGEVGDAGKAWDGGGDWEEGMGEEVENKKRKRKTGRTREEEGERRWGEEGGRGGKRKVGWTRGRREQTGRGRGEGKRGKRRWGTGGKEEGRGSGEVEE